MERKIKIKATNKINIYGVLRGSLKQPLIIFVHGLTGNMHEHIFFNGARYFEKIGFSTFRFNLYGYQKDTRNLLDCTLKIHAHDLNRVVKYFRNKSVKKIFIVGHSYGGPTILLANSSQFDATVLWDPTYLPDTFRDIDYVRRRGDYILHWGSDILISKQMLKEALSTSSRKLLARFHKPVMLVFAGSGSLVITRKKYTELGDKVDKIVTIKNAGHNFNEEGTEEKLFNVTGDWFKKN